MDDVDATLSFRVVAKSEKRHTVSGWAYVSKDNDGQLVVDHSGDVLDVHDLEKAMHEFMKDAQHGSGEMHEGDAPNTVVEAITFTPEKIRALGLEKGALPQGAFITVEVSPETFGKVREGALLAFSIQGKSETIPV